MDKRGSDSSTPVDPVIEDGRDDGDASQRGVHGAVTAGSDQGFPEEHRHRVSHEKRNRSGMN